MSPANGAGAEHRFTDQGLVCYEPDPALLQRCQSYSAAPPKGDSSHTDGFRGSSRRQLIEASQGTLDQPLPIFVYRHVNTYDYVIPYALIVVYIYIYIYLYFVVADIFI